MCLISMIHSMTLHLHLQSCLLAMCRETKKSYLLMDVFWMYFFCLYSSDQDLVSVVFDFSDSLNDVAPASPMLLPVGKKRKQVIC